MTSIRQKFFVCALALIANEAQAAIVADGPWTGNDWYNNSAKIGVKNGIPYSKDQLTQHMLTAPLTLDGPINEYMSMKNVQLVNKIFPASKWSTAFPHANAVYTHDNFLKAVAKFPAFCNESNKQGSTIKETCKQELSTIFAHWGQETGKRSP